MRPEHDRVGIVILAAGGSTRLGRPKQLLLYRGRSLLRHAAETALAAGADPAVVVLGADAARIRPEVSDLPLTIAENPAWEEGMSSSIRTGIAALPDNTDAAILMLCDQPLVTADTLRALIASHAEQNGPAASSAYPNGALGPPCLFARLLFPGLLALSGPQGAKQVLNRLPPGTIVRVPFAGGQTDIDTPEDWDRFNDTAVTTARSMAESGILRLPEERRGSIE